MFEKIRLDEELAALYGIAAEGPLTGLDSRVAITGPNGSGKTRLLKLLAEQLHADRKDFEHFATLIHPETHHWGEQINAACSLACGESTEPDVKRAQILAAMKRFADRYRIRGSTWRELTKASKWPRVVYLYAGRESSRHFRSKYTRDEDVEDKDLRAFPQDTLDEFARAQFLSAHPGWLKGNEELQERAKGFAATVSALVGAKLDVQIQGTAMHATLNGRRVDQDALSEGQRMLLRWAQLIHEEVADLQDAVVLIDEPELHLHPHALIEAMERLVALGPAQIWVATHSIPLLAWFEPKRIYCMDQGYVSWAGNQINHVLAGLLGDNDGPARLRGFLTDAGSLAFHQFAAECLMQPGVIPLREGDPQANLFATSIGEMLQSADEDVCVLEYGAGCGRLIEALSAIHPEKRSRLRYHAYNDPNCTTEEDRQACLEQLARLEAGRAADHYCEDLREHQYHDTHKMNVAVVCNVLHEIPPHDWPRLMIALGQCLHTNGHLLILEDQQMSVGEMPHHKGYLVLDEVELCALFGVARGSASLRYFHDGRLSVAEISSNQLTECTPDRVNKALKQVQARALKQIQVLRRQGTSSTVPEHRRGRQHAYYAMLYANATLARTDS
jgi:energy-coupling factor transporter ATP-binding protein EcfA2